MNAGIIDLFQTDDHPKEVRHNPTDRRISRPILARADIVGLGQLFVISLRYLLL